MTEPTGEANAVAAAPPAPAAPAVASAAATRDRLNYLYIVIVGVAIGLIAIVTAFAWPLAILLGMMLGQAGVEESRGVKQPASLQILRALVLVIGFFVMLFLGALVGGVIALLIVALAAFAERVSANTTPTDRGIARILLFIVATVVWGVLFFVLQVRININIGG